MCALVQWLNYHHLRYFWAVAREGSLRRAAEKLSVSQPSVSAQIRELEQALGVPLFRRSGRSNVLTDAGQIALRYAEEIFTLGGELQQVLRQAPTAQTMRLYVGVADSFPKLVTNEILQPVFEMPQTVNVICREGKIEDLLAQLAAHRLDIVLADEPATGNLNLKAFNHLLGDCGLVFCAEARLAQRLRRGYPKSLAGAPALWPTPNTAMRRSLEQWFGARGLRPDVVGEFEDAALMKVMAADGKGWIPVPSIVAKEALQRYKLQVFGTAEDCREHFYAITAERRIHHPAVARITEAAQRKLAAS